MTQAAIHRRRMSILLLAGLGLLAGPVSANEALGRLFTTPAQRAHLDQMRARAEAAKADPENAALADAQSPPPPTPIAVNGLARRSQRSQALWLNGSAYGPAHGSLQPVLPSADVDPLPQGDRVLVRPQGAAQHVTVKPGQVLDPVSGLVMEQFEFRALAPASTNNDVAVEPDAVPAPAP